MALVKIITYPHETLLKRAEEVTDFGEELRVLVSDMAETMYANDGLGLAANQVDLLARVFVIDLGERDADGSGLLTFVNPTIVERSGELVWEEGCLSFPELHVKVRRWAKLVVNAQDQEGTPFSLAAEDLLAVAIQHELDHLEGITMIDRLGKMSRKLALRRYKRLLAKEAGGEEEDGR